MELKIGDYVVIQSQWRWARTLIGRVGKVKSFPDTLYGPCRDVLVETSTGNYRLSEYELGIATDVEILEYKLRGG